MTVGLVPGSGVDDYSATEFAIPRIIMGARDSATVMEVLKVWFYVGLEDLGDHTFVSVGALSTTVLRAQDATVNAANVFANALFPTTFAYAVQNNQFLTSGGLSHDMPMTVDLTDNNGNGVLIATDKIFVTCGMLGNTNVSAHCVKILYRMVNVGITEYVGIVQSQIA